MDAIFAAFLLAVAEVENTPKNTFGLTKAAIADVNRIHRCYYKMSDRRNKDAAAVIVMRYYEPWRLHRNAEGSCRRCSFADTGRTASDRSGHGARG
jgi:hypothetical protein